jgi:hypothetical protein
MWTLLLVQATDSASVQRSSLQVSDASVAQSLQDVVTNENFVPTSRADPLGHFIGPVLVNQQSERGRRRSPVFCFGVTAKNPERLAMRSLCWGAG